MGISEATFHNWNGKYVGIEASDVKRLKELEAELARYKKLVGELTSENKAMRGLIEKKL
jgi:putative transposase